MDPADARISYDEIFGQNGMSRDLVRDRRALQNVATGVVDIGTLPAAPPLAGLIDLAFARDAAK